MDDLMKLAERVEAATGPDRELDCLIYADRMGGGEWVNNVLRAVDVNLGAIDPGEHSRNFTCWFDPTPRYTASLDAATALVPEGWAFGVGHDFIDEIGGWAWCSNRMSFDCTKAATPTLALCAAALRAHLDPSSGKV